MSTFWHKVNKRDDGCWEWTGGRDRDGYGTVGVNGKTQRAHRVSYEMAHGPIPVGKLICHTCDHPWCVNPDHLFVGTHADNTADCVAKGRIAAGARHGSCTHPECTAIGERNGMHTHPECRHTGERNGQAKLTWGDVRAIRVAYASGGITMAKLAQRHGVHRAMVGYIISGECWKEQQT